MPRATEAARRIATAMMRRVAAARANTDRWNDRGDVIGWVIMIPLSITLFLSAVQVAMWFQARNMCQGAAQSGATAGSTLTAGPDDGRAAAQSYITSEAGSSVTSAHASEQQSATTVTVTCHAHAFTLLPLPGLTTADQSATATRERFTTPGTP